MQTKEKHSNTYIHTIKHNIDEKESSLSQSEIDIIKNICEEDLYLFAIRYFSHYLKKPSSKFHKFLYDLIPSKLNDLTRKEGVKYAIAAPRGGAKSSILSLIVPLWCMAYEKKKFIVIISDTAKKAESFLADIKREVRFNAKLAKDFPELVGKGAVWRANQIETTNSITVLALGTGNNIRGERVSVDRPDLVLMDDLENSEMLRSPSQREFVRFQWFNKDVLPVGGEEGTITDFFVVGTILGKDSLLNALLDVNEYPDWESKRFSAVLEFSVSPLWETWAELYKNKFNEKRKEVAFKFFKDNEEDMLRGTKVLWPEGEPYYKLMLHQLSDPSGFICVDKDTDIILDNYSTKKIKDINIGDSILDKLGNSQIVTDTGTSQLNNRKVYDIKVAGNKDKVRVTEDHPFLIYPNIKYSKFNINHQHLGKIYTGSGNLSSEADRRILENQVIWKQANELKVGDATIFPLPKKDINVCTCTKQDWYWLVGLFLAEGSIGANNSLVQISMALHERHYLEKARKICKKYKYGTALTIQEKHNVLNLHICSKKLVSRLLKYGRLSYTKQLTSEEDNLCFKCFEQLWNGFFVGDGYIVHKRTYQCANSASYNLLYDFHKLWNKFQYISYLYNIRDFGTCVIHNKTWNQRPLYQLAVINYKANNKNTLQAWTYKDNKYSKIQKIEEVQVPNDYKTWWVSTQDKTFCVPNAIVHNTEKQNSPVDITKIMITEDQLHWENFLHDPDIARIIRSKYNPIFGALDPSLGKKATIGDFSCIVTLMRDLKSGYLFVLDIDISRRSVEDQIEAVIFNHRDFGYKNFAVETNAFQQVVADNIRTISKITGAYVPITEILNYSDKKMRIEGIIPFIADGTVVFDTYKYNNNQKYHLGVEQLCTFTGENDRHDDFPDALEMCMRIAKKPRFRTLTKKNK